MTYREDESRIREPHLRANFAWLNRFTLSLLKQHPGKDSIAAVLDPEPTKAIYFVADGTGGHVFAETLAEHNANVAKWRAIRAARGI